MKYLRLMKTRNSGFTLVELLIVVIIIGVLAGMMLMSVGSASDRTKTTVCEADRRELKTAWVSSYGSESTFGGRLSDALSQLSGKYTVVSSGDSSAELADICPAGGHYLVSADGANISVKCTNPLHADAGNVTLSKQEIIAGVETILTGSGKISDKIAAMEKAYGGDYSATYLSNSELSKYILSITGTWPKADGALLAELQRVKNQDYYVQPYYLNSGTIIYWAGPQANDHNGWVPSAIEYNGKWYVKDTGVTSSVSNLYSYSDSSNTEDAYKDKNLNFMDSSGNINSGWTEVK